MAALENLRLQQLQLEIIASTTPSTLSLSLNCKVNAGPVTATERASCLDAAEDRWLYRAPNKLKPIEDSFDFQSCT